MAETMEADFVVVGAGSAGSVLAARLSEDPACRVLLVEAGKRESLHITRLPAAIMRTIGNPRYDWAYTSEPDPTRDNQSELWPRGKVPGGSSSINGMIFIRGAREDFDRWEAMGCTGWGWDNVLPLYRKLETSDAADNAARGGMGPQRVSALGWKHPLAADFIASGVAAGIPANEDLNGARHEGIAWNQGAIRRGLRHSSFDAFIRPNLARPNLKVIDGVLVERIAFEGARATGLAARRDGQAIDIRAARGVVLCAGSINSPHLLMLSGVGDPEALAQHGIETRIASPQVGRNLMEHPGLYVQAEMNEPTLNREAQPLRAAWQALRWMAGLPSPFGVPSAQVLAFFRSQADAAEPDLQFHLFPYGSVIRNGKRIIPARDLATILVNVNHPRSRGHLALRSANPADPIAIHPRLLDDDHDVETLLRGLDWVRRMAETPPFGPKVRELIGVPPRSAGRDADIAFLRSAARPFYHPAGTCRMGADAAAVVGPDLAVKGAEALWVADVFIFPRHIAGNTNATALMIGERAAEIIGSRT